MKKVVYALWLGCSFFYVTAEDWAAKGRLNKAFGLCAPRSSVLTIGYLRSLAVGFALRSLFYSTFMEVSFWGR